jgi:ankyrin repeat protein
MACKCFSLFFTQGLLAHKPARFLLARLHVDSLLDKDTKKKVKSALEHLSGGTEALKKAYDGAIERIDGQLPGKTARAKSVLSWISYAARPLTTSELCHALAVELDEEELDEDNIPDVEEIVSVCAGLVTVDEESNVIRLVHYTTQDYLKGIRETWNPSAQYDIASTCLAYLCFKTFRSGSCASDEEFESRLEQNTFLDYSARYWGEHAATVQEKVSGLAMRLLQDDGLVACAVQTRSISSYKYGAYSQHFRERVTGLHLAALLGLVHLSEGLLSRMMKEKVTPVDSKDERGQTPLSWAAEAGHEAVVKLLVKWNDVKVDSKDILGQTPLSRAAVGGQEAVVKLLVERDDVEADSKDRRGRTPLSWAAEEGHEAVVKVLVERDDVEADSKDRRGRTPLSWAAEEGHEAVVKVLVERDDVEADSKDLRGRTPLSWAAKEGHEAVVKVLVERDDVKADLKDLRSRTPLSWAAGYGHEAVVKVLVERDDVEADSKDDWGQTPLSSAARQGHEAVVKVLESRPTR